MSYHQTNARKEFKTTLSAALKEVQALYPTARERNCSARLLGLYYTFSYSQLEIYIKKLIEDTIITFNESSIHMDKWPDLMLGYLIHKSESLGADYKKFSADEDEGALIIKIARTARKINSWHTNSKDPFIADTNDFLDKKRYPSPRNLPQIFRRLGIDKIWQVISKAGNINSELTLKSLNDLRTGIAHEGEIPEGFNLKDLKRLLTSMDKFVAALDRGVSSHFCSDLIPRNKWNQCMASSNAH